MGILKEKYNLFSKERKSMYERRPLYKSNMSQEKIEDIDANFFN